MRKINKDETPAFWKDYVAHNKGKSYDNADKAKRKKLRQHMLKIQGYLCAYCCSEINESNSHNEHIKPKAGNRYPKLSMDYENMVVSCTTGGDQGIPTCGMHKGDTYDEKLFVSPLSDDCADHFQFLQNGKILGLTEAGEDTIKVLNLNAPKLVGCRRTLFDELNNSRSLGKEYIQQYYVEEQDGKLPRYVDMTEYFLKSGFFD